MASRVGRGDIPLPLIKPDVRISRIRLSCRHSRRGMHQTAIWPRRQLASRGRVSQCQRRAQHQHVIRPRQEPIGTPPVLLQQLCSRGPLLHGHYPASSLVWPPPTPDAATRRLCLPVRRCGTARTAPGLPGSSTDRSARAVPSHTGRPEGCSRLPHRRRASPIPAGWPPTTGVTRPKRVRLRYGSRVCSMSAPAPRLLRDTAHGATC